MPLVMFAVYVIRESFKIDLFLHENFRFTVYVDYTYYVNYCMICSPEMIYSFYRTSQPSTQVH